LSEFILVSAAKMLVDTTTANIKVAAATADFKFAF
jgi:hypothetical protein